jgi:hypothetical protein
VQSILDGYPNIRMLAHYFENTAQPAAAATVPVLATATARQPLIVSIDRWGYTPLRPTPITPQALAAITRAHLAGDAPTHRTRTRRVRVPAALIPARNVGDEPVTLDHQYYRRGLHARRRAQAWLTTVGDELDGVASRADELLQQLAAIVDDAATRPDEE